jgi:hypothetical protein
MDMTIVKEKAKKLGIKNTKKDARGLIREIQTVEGNAPCFKSDIARSCSLNECLWRSDCVQAS